MLDPGKEGCMFSRRCFFADHVPGQPEVEDLASLITRIGMLDKEELSLDDDRADDEDDGEGKLEDHQAFAEMNVFEPEDRRAVQDVDGREGGEHPGGIEAI